VPTVNTRGRWLLRVGVLVVAALWPLLIGSIGGAGRAQADCLSYFGSRNDGPCLNGAPGTIQTSGGAVSGGIPPVSRGPAQNAAPGTVQTSGGAARGGVPPVAVAPGQNGGAGVSSGPLLPGQTINQPLTP
jgi:hypothetical protein